MAYILSHWRGRQSITWSFWVNLVGLAIAIYLLEWGVQSALADQLPVADWIGVLSWILLQTVVMIWQIVGFLRASDFYLISGHGAIELVWAGYGAILVIFIIATNSWFTLLAPLLSASNGPVEIDADILDRQRAAQYSLTIVSNDTARRDGITLARTGRFVWLKGSFELGITKNLKALLDRHDDITGLILESDGGRIYEGRSIARLARDRGLNTYVLRNCNSACTTAFIGGKIRALGANGKLGFHKYWHDAQLQHPFVDLGEEQEKDRQFYGSQNIKAQFLNRIFDMPSTGLWQPDYATMLEAGVVHKILPARRDDQ